MKLLYTKLVHWAFDRFYREFSWTYDAVAALVSAGYWSSWTVAALPYLRGRVLELGCGTGYLQCALARDASVPFAVGLDHSRQMLQHAQGKAEHAGVRVRLLRANAQKLPFPSASFDTLVATFPSEYIVATETMAEAHRVLRPGGRFVILPAAQFSSTGLYERLVDLAYRLTLQTSPRSFKHPAITDTPNEVPFSMVLHHALSEAGFTVRSEWVSAPGGHVLLVTGKAEA